MTDMEITSSNDSYVSSYENAAYFSRHNTYMLVEFSLFLANPYTLSTSFLATYLVAVAVFSDKVNE